MHVICRSMSEKAPTELRAQLRLRRRQQLSRGRGVADKLELLAESCFAGGFLAGFESEIVVVLTFEIVISHSFRNFEFKISANRGENKAKVTFCG